MELKATFKLYPKAKAKAKVSAYSLPSSSEMTPASARFGWAGSDKAKAAYDKLRGGFPDFFIKAQTQATNGKRVCLWDFAKKALNSHIPTFTQLIGDCVSQGASNAVEYLQTVEIIRLKQPEKYRPIFQPYIYGISRVQIGKGQLGLNQDGSLGVWAARGVQQYGVLAADEQNVPKYSAQVAKEWGKKGPPSSFIDIGKKHLLKTVSKVTNYDMVRDAIANGYPVTVASNRGFRMKGVADKGKLWGVPSGVWMHQMTFIGVDDDQKRPGCYCMNSWGENAHGAPVDDAPPGGFWTDADVVDYMVRQDDSWAFSQFDGYPEQKLDFMLI